MRFAVFTVPILGLVGCGSTIGALDSLPTGPDVSGVAWPKLVDTPSLPEDRLNLETGERAAERLIRRKVQAGERLVSANATQPVSDALVIRGGENQNRVSDGTSLIVDDATLLARAARAQERSRVVDGNVDEAGLRARASRQTERYSLDRSAVDETDLVARAVRQIGRSDGNTLDATSGTTAAPTPRAPVPLRPLDTPVVSSSFEERARQARLRASKAGN